MKVVLVLPDQTKLEELKGWWYPPPSKRNGKPSLPSLGMLYLCAAIKSGHDAVYIDNSVHKLSDALLAEAILKHTPDAVGFGGTMQEWPQAAGVAALLKSIDPNLVTVYGGPNATARPEKHIHYFDFVFRGMAELSFKEFLDRLEGRQPLGAIAGLCSKTFDAIASPAVVEELDTLPWPDREKINLSHYQREFPNLCAPTDVLMTSRGCPFDCRFCSSQYIWNRRFLKHSVERVIEEIRFMKEEYGTRSIHFREDNLTVDKNRLVDLCGKLANLDLEWTCQSRVNSLTEDTVKMMKDAGCRLISCGFESINDSTLQYLRKRQTARQILNVIEIFERVGIHYTGAYIVATPNEGKQEIENTIRFALKVAKLPHSRTPDAVTRFVGIPVSELYFQIVKDGLVEYDWQQGELLFPRTYQMSSAAIDDLIRETYASASSGTAVADTPPVSVSSRMQVSDRQPDQRIRQDTDPENGISKMTPQAGAPGPGMGVDSLPQQVTVIIRSIGERTEKCCYDRIRHQVPAANIHIVRERPFTEAVRKTFQVAMRENRKWTCVVDADILVMPRIFEKMTDYAETVDDNVFSIIGTILDKFLESPRVGGVHLYRTRFIKHAMAMIPDPYAAIRPENHVLNMMKKQGFPFVLNDIVSGLHDYEQYYRDVYRKCFIHAKKNATLVEVMLPQWRRMAEQDPDYQVAIAAFHAGLKYPGKTSIDINAPFMDKFQDVMRTLSLSEKTELWPSDPNAFAIRPDAVGGAGVKGVQDDAGTAARGIALAEDSMRQGNWTEAIRQWQDVAAALGEQTPAEVYRRLDEAYQKQAAFPPGTPQEEQHLGDGDKHRLLESLHRTLEPARYLEIGVQRGQSLALAQCDAIGVDPMPAVRGALPEKARLMTMTSDEFFKGPAPSLLSNPPELVFIDGMHLFEYALRDFMNVEKYSSPRTLVVMDDVFPVHPAQAERRRRTRTWTGDVWKVYEILRRRRPDLFLLPLNTSPTGLLLIAGLNPANRSLWDSYDALVQEYSGQASVPADILDRRGVRSTFDAAVPRLLHILRQQRHHPLNAEALVARLRQEVLGTPSAADGAVGRAANNGNKIAIYTAISGDYDELRPPQVVSENCSYICYSDNPKIVSDIWDIRPLPQLTNDPARNAKIPKLLAHLLLDAYEMSVWVDGNFTVKGDLGRLAQSVLKNHTLALFRHPEDRLSVYDEARACIERGKDNADVIREQVRYYASAGLPADPIPACGVIFRRHNDPAIIHAMEDWWQQVSRFSRRDQLSFGYVAWKNKLDYYVINDNIRENRCLQWEKHAISPQRSSARCLGAIAQKPLSQPVREGVMAAVKTEAMAGY